MKYVLHFVAADGVSEDIAFSMEITAESWYDAWEVGQRLAQRLGLGVESVDAVEE